MKKCNHCDREVMDDAKFCQYCGADIPEEVVEPTLENKDSVTENDDNVAPPLPKVKSTATYDPGTSYSQSTSSEYTDATNKGLVWLILSSIVTLLGCCCLPLGFLQIATIITSAIAVNNYSKGDYEGSNKMARISMILFFSLLALSILTLILLLATGAVTNFFNSYEFINEFY